LLSETFTNAVRYSRGDLIEVSAFGDGHAVGVEVVDGGGDTLPQFVHAPCGEGGRGVPILWALAGDWGFQALGDGRLGVWFTVGSRTVTS
jgi:anti-sigma regulatory factor (Ser/Thr protein kinase)